MPDRVFLDTNILLYAFASGDARQNMALDLLLGGGAIGVQSLNEFVNVATRKWKIGWPETLVWVEKIGHLCDPVVPLTWGLHRHGLSIARQHGYDIHDALILAAALEADSSMFYSEDLHDGHELEGMLIRNPFAKMKKARH